MRAGGLFLLGIVVMMILGFAAVFLALLHFILTTWKDIVIGLGVMLTPGLESWIRSLGPGGPLGW